MRYLAFVFLLLLALGMPLQLLAQSPARSDAPYLVPQTIFVGDSGRLVVPLGRSFAAIGPFVWDTPDKLPASPDIVIRRIELDRRGGASRLLIDFIPYAPGILTIPTLELSSSDASPMAAKPPALAGLEVQVASILTPSQMVLSEPASPLAVPGTSLLIYGTILLFIFLIFLGILVSVWSRRHFRDLWERLRRRYLLRSMLKFLWRLKQECGLDKEIDPASSITRLSGEFREFLSLFTKINCRSLTAGEFLNLPLSLDLNPVYLCNLFRDWDTLRFSGEIMEMKDLISALDETEDYIQSLEKAEREKPLPSGTSAEVI